ncbi:hypothetical protein [Rhodoflexus caldus]|uniref:hypothetical protein n=1 Tax=Rhodoflexus caldus TaxID=2891236 RepID=UPI002029B70E|nr:hypothetical protein [Rhodoflexus caldus]
MKNIRTYIYWLAGMVVLLTGRSGYAQEAPLSLKDFFIRYAQVRSQMHQIGAEAMLSEFFDPRMTGARADYDINNQLKITKLDYKSTQERYLSELESGIITQIKPVKILHESVKDNKGLLTAINEQSKIKDGQVLEKHTVIYTMLLLPDEQRKWKIYNYTATYLIDEKNKGLCTCELYNSSNGNIASRLIYPEGESMTTALDYFSFNSATKTITASNGQSYYWDGSTVSTPDKKHQLGAAKTAKDAITLIILKDLYSKFCTEIRLK